MLVGAIILAAAAAAIAATTAAATAGPSAAPGRPDWLRSADPARLHPTAATASPDGTQLVLSNGLTTRTFVLHPNFATVDYSLDAGDWGAGQSFIRGLSPEARLFLDGIPEPVDVGGLAGEARFLLWYPQTVNLTADPAAFQYSHHELSQPVARWQWRPMRNSDNASWPPRGVHLAVHFLPPASPATPPTGHGNGTIAMTELVGFEVGCQADGTGAISCLSGHPSCDNTTVPGQCTLPWATAPAICSAWPECQALNCNGGAAKPCQAREHRRTNAAPGAIAFVKPAPPFPYPELRVVVHYELYDGLPTLVKWVEVQNTAAVDSAGRHHRHADYQPTHARTLPREPLLAQLTVERLHVPWHLRQRLHCETDFMPQIGVRNSFEDAGWFPASGHYSANFTALTNPPGNLWRYDTGMKLVSSLRMSRHADPCPIFETRYLRLEWYCDQS
jgi:hypothetical protein